MIRKMNKISMKVFPKTIYNDIIGLPDPMLLGITIHYYNHSDVALYMKIFGSGPTGWSSNSVALGSLASGTNAYINLDNFLSRTKPSVATTESITLLLKGYSDAGYTIEVASFQRIVTVIFIKSDDGTWTTDFSDNFDDGTIQGWSAWADRYKAGYPTIAVATDYVLSTPYSLKAINCVYYWYDPQVNIMRIYKSFLTPNKTTVYAILNVRMSRHDTYGRIRYERVQNGTTVLIHLGVPLDGTFIDAVPPNKWMRLIVPLPANTTVEIRVEQGGAHFIGNLDKYFYIWLDDFKIISKD